MAFWQQAQLFPLYTYYGAADNGCLLAGESPAPAINQSAG
jgi:hypothetical protein